MEKPKVNSEGQKQLNKAAEQFESFDREIKQASADVLVFKNQDGVEQQTKMSNREADKADAPTIKPLRSINSKEPFNEKYRDEWKRMWEYVKCIVENYEVVGESVPCWTKKFAGDPAHEWKVPVNKPVYIPRLLAEQLSKCKYHRIMMEDKPTEHRGEMTFYGAVSVNREISRIDARPVGGSFVSMAG